MFPGWLGCFAPARYGLCSVMFINRGPFRSTYEGFFMFTEETGFTGRPLWFGMILFSLSGLLSCSTRHELDNEMMSKVKT